MKRFISIAVVVYLSIILIVFWAFSKPTKKLFNSVQANDILYTVQNDWPDVEKALNTLNGYEVEYIIIGMDNKILGASSVELMSNYSVDMLYQNRIADIKINDETQGKIIFIDNSEKIILQIKEVMKYLCIVIISMCFLMISGILYYINKSLVRPAKILNDFTRQLSSVNYDISIPKYDSKLFGLFSESFDIMREELLALRKKELEADKNRREIIAAISHDIKNPIASIQAIAEFQFYTVDKEESRREFGAIIEKTNQINYLIQNLHISAMDELGHLTIEPKEEESAIVKEILQKADYKNKIKSFQLLECLLLIDKIRLSQIVDNIISNSYKYADTSIEINSYYENGYLCICINDFGCSVLKDEEFFLTQKFYRGKNAKNKEGSGIGLYISEYLMIGMGGKLLCHIGNSGGFEVIIYLKLV